MVDNCIKEALECDHIQSYPIEDFTIEQLDELSEKAKRNNLLVTLKAEHSNVYQGVLVSVVKRNIVNEFLEYL